MKKWCPLFLIAMGLSACVLIDNNEDSPNHTEERVRWIHPDLLPQWEQDPADLNEASITEDTLHLSLSFSGGCATHRFDLLVLEGIMESAPPRAHAVLAHDDKDDACDAYLTETITFDLTPIKTVLASENALILLLKVGERTEEVLYEF